MIHGSSTSPIAFQWDAWYASVGGRSIHIAEVDEYLKQIRDYQYPRFTGEVNTQKTTFPNAQKASLYIKNKARILGADEVGIALIEPSDVYKGRVIHEPFAIVVGQKMLWREFQGYQMSAPQSNVCVFISRLVKS